MKIVPLRRKARLDRWTGSWLFAVTLGCGRAFFKIMTARRAVTTSVNPVRSKLAQEMNAVPSDELEETEIIKMYNAGVKSQVVPGGM